MIIPYQELDPDTLINVIETIILREGTDYGEVELSLTEKVELVKKQLDEGKAQLEYSEEHETVNIIPL